MFEKNKLNNNKNSKGNNLKEEYRQYFLAKSNNGNNIR